MTPSLATPLGKRVGTHSQKPVANTLIHETRDQMHDHQILDRRLVNAHFARVRFARAPRGPGRASISGNPLWYYIQKQDVHSGLRLHSPLCVAARCGGGHYSPEREVLAAAPPREVLAAAPHMVLAAAPHIEVLAAAPHIVASQGCAHHQRRAEIQRFLA